MNTVSVYNPNPECRAQTPKVSVIMPMYRCADFVDGALDMVCGQTFRDIEIICVLDGPDDAIKSRVDARAATDPRITCLVQEHGGAGTARNTGMDIAKGDYLLFLDADDLFEPHMIERMVDEAATYDADTVMCSYTLVNNWTKATTRGHGFDFSKYPEGRVTDCTGTEDLYRSFIAAPWNKMFRRQMITDNRLRFSETRIQNDVFFVTSAMCCTKRLAVIKEDLLSERRYLNGNSISSNRAKHTEDCLIALKEIYDWLRARGSWKMRRKDYYYMALNSLHYQAGYDYNERFTDGMAHMLSKEQPWKNMSNAEVTEVLDLRINKLKRAKNTQRDEMRALRTTGKPECRQRLRTIDNKIKAFEEIQSLMKNKYGRDIKKKDNPVSLLVWSLRHRGLKGTIRKIRQKLQGDIVLEPSGMICSGHITLAGHYLVFFVPTEIVREDARVEELSVTVRCNGYYPIAVSGDNKDIYTPLGPSRTPVISGGASTRRGEVMRAYAEMSPGLGIYVQVRFLDALLKNNEGGKADNNHPVSVQITGKIRLK